MFSHLLPKGSCEELFLSPSLRQDVVRLICLIIDAASTCLLIVQAAAATTKKTFRNMRSKVPDQTYSLTQEEKSI